MCGSKALRLEHKPGQLRFIYSGAFSPKIKRLKRGGGKGHKGQGRGSESFEKEEEALQETKTLDGKYVKIQRGYCRTPSPIT